MRWQGSAEDARPCEAGREEEPSGTEANLLADWKEVAEKRRVET